VTRFVELGGMERGPERSLTVRGRGRTAASGGGVVHRKGVAKVIGELGRGVGEVVEVTRVLPMLRIGPRLSDAAGFWAAAQGRWKQGRWLATVFVQGRVRHGVARAG
jgi:hypothetical protein